MVMGGVNDTAHQTNFSNIFANISVVQILSKYLVTDDH
jgi:hypothetical protein